MKNIALLFILLTSGLSAFGQTSEALLKLLIDNNLITSQQADSIRKNESRQKKSFLVETASQIQLSGYSQIRYQMFDEKTRIDGFDIRRARLDLRGKISPRFSYRLQTDMADRPKILDAYGEIKIADYLMLTIGQFRIPLSPENLASVNRLEVIDYAQVVDALCARGKDVIGNHNGRDIGIQAGGTLIKNEAGPILEYRLGVFNGSGMNMADTSNNAKDFAGRVILSPVKGLSLGLSYYNGLGKAIKPAPEFVGKSQERDRLGIDANYTFENLLIRAEYIQGRDGDFNRAGWYIMAGYYIIPKKLQTVVRYDTYDPETGTDNNISTYYSGGINYNFNGWSRLQAFYTIRQEEGTKIDNNYLSVQYQIGF
jgi:hypothetical protein